MPIDTIRFKLGDFECIVLQDGSLEVPASFLFTNAPPDELAQALRAYQLQPDQIAASLNCLLIDTGQQLVLLDTGMGPGHGPALGNLRQNLRGVGLKPEDIDWVVLSHGHPDHLGGNTEPDGLPAFPNARYVMWKEEWDFWTSEANLIDMEESWATTARRNLLSIQDRLELITQETDLVPGIRLITAPGHTPGHMGLLATSRNENLLCMGDAVGHPISLEHPDWYVGSDMILEQVLATRRLLCEQAVRADALVFSNHFLFPGLGHLAPHEGAWHWQPVEV